MNTHSALQKLNPWNWFKHEESATESAVPVKRDTAPPATGESPLASLHHQINRLFDDAFKDMGLPNFAFTQLPDDGNLNFRPSLNLACENERYILTLEAPGLAEKDLDIEVRDDVLTIRGNKMEEKEDKDKHYYRMERRYGAFQRVLALPVDVDVGDIEASMKNGLLTVVLPRNPQVAADAKKIPIKH